MIETLPEGWAFATLGDLATYVTSGSRDWSKYYSDRGALFIRTQDINQNKLTALANIARVTLPKRVEGKRTLTEQGDLLITITGANVGKCAYVDQALPEAYVSQSVALVKLIAGINGQFLHGQLMSPSSEDERTLLQRSAYGVGRPVLNLENVREVLISIAPLNEQHRIVEKVYDLLPYVNSARDHLSRVPAILKRFRQAVLAAACSGKLTEDWRQRNPSRSNTVADLLDQINVDARSVSVPDAEDPLDPFEIPAEWLWTRCGHLCDSQRAITYGVIKLGPHVEKGVPTLRSSDVRWLWIDTKDVKRISNDVASRYERTFLSGGEVLVTVRGTLGGVAVVPTHMAGFNISREVAVLPIDRSLSAPFFSYAISAPWSQKWLLNVSKGVAYTGINIRDLKRLPLPVPPIAEQDEIIRRVKALLSIVDGMEQRTICTRSRVNRLTQSILAKAFRGELVPTEAELARREGREYEPASVLLERIKKEREEQTSSKPKQQRRSGKAGLAAAKGRA